MPQWYLKKKFIWLNGVHFIKWANFHIFKAQYLRYFWSNCSVYHYWHIETHILSIQKMYFQWPWTWASRSNGTLLSFFSFSTKSVSKLLQNLRNNTKLNFKHRTISSFLKFFIVLEGWGTDFSKVSHLYAITIAYRGSNFSKKHSSYSWTIHTARIFGNNCISLNGGRSIKCPNFFKFQCSISLLCLKI